MSLLVLLSVLAGFVLLIAGAEGFVRGAAKLAAVIGLSPLVIGLTVVSYGTSAPELAVSLQASLHGQAEIALGNVIGSNIFNILMTLGIAALIVPLTVAQQLIRLDVPIMIGVTGLMLMFSMDGELGRVDGIILLLGSIFYTGFLVYQSRRESDAEVQAEYEKEYADVSPKTWQHLLFISYYVAYTAYLGLNAIGHDQLGLYSNVMLLFVIPLSVITLVTIVIQRPKKLKKATEVAKAEPKFPRND